MGIITVNSDSVKLYGEPQIKETTLAEVGENFDFSTITNIRFSDATAILGNNTSKTALFAYINPKYDNDTSGPANEDYDLQIKFEQAFRGYYNYKLSISGTKQTFLSCEAQKNLSTVDFSQVLDVFKQLNGWKVRTYSQYSQEDTEAVLSNIIVTYKGW